MKNIKDIILSIFAIIGFISIITAFNTQPEQQTHGTPESHVWEFHISTDTGSVNPSPSYAINKVTGEVRKYENSYLGIKTDGTLRNTWSTKYAVTSEAK